MENVILETIEKTFADRQTTIVKDLKINYKRQFEDSRLSVEEVGLTTLALAQSLNWSELKAASWQFLKGQEVAQEAILEAEEIAGLMGMLNIYYRFRHFVEEGGAAAEDYGPAKLRMQAMARPQLSKEKFEMLCLAVSILNGCEKCVTSHEKALLDLGLDREKLHDLARLTAAVSGLSRLQERS